MKTKQIRELQVSSSQLALIFLVILGVAIVIFLLGVSIGKKYHETQQEGTQLSPVVERQPASSETLAKRQEVVTPSPEKKEPVEPTSETVLKTKPEPKEIAATSTFEKREREESKAKQLKTEVTPSREAKKPEKEAYFIQIGAFTKKEATTQLIQALKKAGYQPILLDPWPTDKTPLYRLRIGPFSSPSEAEAAKNRLRSTFPEAAKAFIVRQ